MPMYIVRYTASMAVWARTEKEAIKRADANWMMADANVDEVEVVPKRQWPYHSPVNSQRRKPGVRRKR